VDAEERRRSPRYKTLKSGVIIFGLAPAVECIIRNISDTGAGIEVKNAAAIPDAFQLLIKPELVKRHCRVIWRKHDWIGAQFV